MDALILDEACSCELPLLVCILFSFWVELIHKVCFVLPKASAEDVLDKTERFFADKFTVVN